MTQLVIPCGGYGTRMSSVTSTRQKCLVEVAGRPFLAHVLDVAVQPPVDRVLLLAAYRADEVDDFATAWAAAHPGIRVDVLAEEVAAGPVAALRSAAEQLDEEFLLVLGDVRPPIGQDLWADLAGVADTTGAAAVMMTAPVSAGRDPGNVIPDGPWVTRYDKASGGPLVDRGVRFLRRRALDEQAGDGDQQFFGGLSARRMLAHHRVDQQIIEVGTPDRWQHAVLNLDGGE
ncbi:NDP-sugar pyrophosphorylase family protein [Allocatelliglobosispora scoriae]|uniref:NDP-sugar pyrophosphorylase family protein n=1 Tax=Allocatelliglobosispora scoriae TaxID=643052 RepID=A0A841BM42_9ACTN|nr:NTP transferase domain-containing protein [Allocatelliglobosispora scoriae]MBB5868326.1 NDP-sugar pyrophosphorylase family protein [Allocatelliglobosispora scoriae]